MIRNWLFLFTACASLTAAPLAVVPASAQPATARQCFSVTEFDNWRAGDAKTIYISVRPNKYFRLDLKGQCPFLLTPGARLLSVFRGPDLICSGLDWDLKVSAGIGGGVEPCIVGGMTRLTPDEAAALPKTVKP